MNWKKALYYAEYILPGVGVYREIRKPKSKKTILGAIGFGIYALPFLIKLAYVGTGVITKEWNPTHYFKDSIEKREERSIDSLKINSKYKKDNKLEKTTTYEEILKIIG